MCCAAGFVPRLNRTEGGAVLPGARQDGVARAVWQRHCFVNVRTVAAREAAVFVLSHKMLPGSDDARSAALSRR